MERLIRGLYVLGGVPSAIDCRKNWLQLQEAGVEPSSREEKGIFRYMDMYWGAFANQPDADAPDFHLVREYFEHSDDVETITRLDESKKAQLYTHTNYAGIAVSVRDRQQVREFNLVCRDAAAIAEHGRAFEKPINGKKHLKGIEDAEEFFKVTVGDLVSKTQAEWTPIRPSDMSKPLEPIRYLLRHFGLSEGRPGVLCGYAGGGKTYLAIELALAVASGWATCWGGLKPSISGPVVHLDYEMGRKALVRRYQRVAHAMGIDWNNIRKEAQLDPGLDVHARMRSIFTHIEEKQAAKEAGHAVHSNDDLLHIEAFPRHHLHSSGMESRLIKLCRGKALLIVDSFRASTAGSKVDENSSEMRMFLDMLSKVSDRTGCCILVLHHERKSAKDGDKGDMPIVQMMRGSSALADAIGASVHVVSTSSGFRVEQGKSSARKAGTSVSLFLEDIGEDCAGWEDTQGIRVSVNTKDTANTDTQLSEDMAIVTRILRMSKVANIKQLYALCATAGLSNHPRVDLAKNSLRAEKVDGYYTIPGDVETADGDAISMEDALQ